MFKFAIFFMLCLTSYAVPVPTRTPLTVPRVPTRTPVPPTTSPATTAPISVKMPEQSLPKLYLVESGHGPLRGVQLRKNFNFCPHLASLERLTIVCSIPPSSSVIFKVNGALVRREHKAPFYIAGNSDGYRYPWKIPAGPVTIECTGNNGVTVKVQGQFHCSRKSTTSHASTAARETSTPVRSPSLTITPSATQTPSPSQTTSPDRKLASTRTSSPSPTRAPSPILSAKPATSSDASPTHYDEQEGTPRKKSIRLTFGKVQDKYPIGVFEAGGAVLESGKVKQLVVFGGFHGFPNITNHVYSRKYGESTAPWTKLENLPAPHATHMAQATDGAMICFAGGFVGAYPGVSGKRAFCFDNDKKKYIHLPDLPDVRAGGGLAFIHNNGVKSLVYSGGTIRDANFKHRDLGTTWTLELGNEDAKWIEAETMEAARNHMGAATTCGRHIFVGGQHTIDEDTGNSNVVSEYMPETRTWSKKPPAPLPIPLGHISASILPYKCGLIVVGGITNGGKMSDAVYYWDSTSDTWTRIGTYPNLVATPVCGIVEDTLMCATGGKWRDQRNVFYGKITAASF